MKLFKKKKKIQVPKIHIGKNISKDKLKSIIELAFLVLTHVGVLLAILLSFRYYSIYPALFGSLVAIILCILAIVDIVFFVGFNHKDLGLKIVALFLAFFLLAGGTVGSIMVAKANGIVNSVLDGSGSAGNYETYSGVFICYDKNNQFTSIQDLADKNVGMLNETEKGLSYIANEVLEENKIEVSLTYYKSNAEMVQALLDGTVDSIAITSAYRSIYETDENSQFTKYLNNFIDFYPFEKELKVENSKTKKDLSKDPFNVLLIGWSRVELESTVGLADTIIIATINPQTYTVSMNSIARDSFVPISCYGGEYDKINSGRSTSRACFIDTVEDLMGMEMDYYIELDYQALIEIVDTLGGVMINNPVDFVLDGIVVDAGQYIASGYQALEFCRERHHMPNGDFDRQQHQKEVIMEIAKKLLESKDINLALECMDNASRWMSTDFTLNELTGIFNMLLNTKNYTGLDTFDLIDFQNSRITGSGGIKYYSYDMRLPLWVYLIYQQSYDETITHINNVMGNYTAVKQTKNFEFNVKERYERPPFYSLDYDEKYLYTPDPMPDYWIDFYGKSVADVMAWVNSKGVSITGIDYISPLSSDYNPELEGLVVEQSARYGSLLTDIGYTTITIMGTGEVDESKQVPSFIEHNYTKAISWAEKYGVPYKVTFDTGVGGKVGDVVEQNYPAYTPIEKVDVFRITVKAGTFKITFDKNNEKITATVPEAITVTTGDDTKTFSNLANVTDYTFLGWFTEKEGGTRVYNSDEVSGDSTLYAHWEYNCVHQYGEWKVTKEADCKAGTDGEKQRTCSKCQKVETEIIKAEHDYQLVETVEPSCDGATPINGYERYKCSKCGDSYDKTKEKTCEVQDPEPFSQEPEPPSEVPTNQE